MNEDKIDREDGFWWARSLEGPNGMLDALETSRWSVVHVLDGVVYWPGDSQGEPDAAHIEWSHYLGNAPGPWRPSYTITYAEDAQAIPPSAREELERDLDRPIIDLPADCYTFSEDGGPVGLCWLDDGQKHFAWIENGEIQHKMPWPCSPSRLRLDVVRWLWSHCGEARP